MLELIEEHYRNKGFATLRTSKEVIVYLKNRNLDTMEVRMAANEAILTLCRIKRTVSIVNPTRYSVAIIP